MPNGFQVTANRIDPYKTFNFELQWDGKTVLGVMKASALKRTTNVITHRSGGENSVDHKTPGRTTYDGITLERGITWDLEFEKWANQVHPYAGDTSMDLKAFRKDVIALVIKKENGQPARRFLLYGCWVSEYQAAPALDSSTNAIAIESIKIEMEGWERDQSVTETSD
jgi:phage tail-like protein